MKFQPPKGTKDLIGNDFYLYQSISQKILEVISSYGFQQVQTPAFESLEVLTKDAGQDLAKQIYTFQDKAGRKMGIKSDITPALARIVAKSSKAFKKPIKFSCYDRVYRYERPKRGRYREIYQINAEAFGAPPPSADAEIIACLYNCYKALGLNRVKIIINSRPLLEQFVTSLNVSPADTLPVIRVIDKQAKITPQQFRRQILAAGLPQNQYPKLLKFLKLKGPLAQTLKRAKSFFTNQPQLIPSVNQLAEIGQLLQNYDNISQNCLINLGLARGFEYYTGIIFEVIDPDNNQIGSLGGGGRYDNLVASFGGPNLPAIGFSIGIDRLALLLQSQQPSPQSVLYTNPTNI